MNSPRMKRGTIVVVILISAFFLSGCGGDDGSETTSPSEWADSLCTDLSQWKSSVTSVAASFGGGGGLSQEEIQDAVNEVASSTETLVGNLQDLGRPDTEAGQEAQDAVNQLADELQTDIGEAERAAAGVSNAADAAQAASSIRDTFTTAQNQVTSAITDLEQLEPQGELTSALEQSDACNELSSD
jgi:methyl-accepting chemotaxis protein